MSEAKSPPPAAATAAAASAGGGGGIKALLPLILTVLLMPVLAYVMTSFVIVPKLQKATVQARAEGQDGVDGHGDAEDGSGGGHGKPEDAHGKKAEDAHGKKTEDAHGKKTEDAHGKKEGGHGSGKPTVPFGKVVVNVAGSLGARYLLVSFTIVGSSSEISEKVESNKDQLMDITLSTLRTKTLQDLERPGSNNLLRTEIVSAFNLLLGKGAVKEIYFTEFAIQ